MTYTIEDASGLYRDAEIVGLDLTNLMAEGVRQSQKLEKDARTQLTQGVGRRLAVLKNAVATIFGLFSPLQVPPLKHEVLTDVQINLHAFVINLSGVFDNWASAFLLRHGLIARVGHYRDIGMFKAKTQALLPTPLREYVTSESIAKWHKEYLTGYRDALAHRIPLYIPPAVWKPTDAETYNALEEQKQRLLSEQQWEQLDKLWAEQDALGEPCFYFMHEFSAATSARPVMLHPQLISDGMTVVEFGNLFYTTWHEHAAGPESSEESHG